MICGRIQDFDSIELPLFQSMHCLVLILDTSFLISCLLQKLINGLTSEFKIAVFFHTSSVFGKIAYVLSALFSLFHLSTSFWSVPVLLSSFVAVMRSRPLNKNNWLQMLKVSSTKFIWNLSAPFKSCARFVFSQSLRKSKTVM